MPSSGLLKGSTAWPPHRRNGAKQARPKSCVCQGQTPQLCSRAPGRTQVPSLGAGGRTGPRSQPLATARAGAGEGRGLWYAETSRSDVPPGALQQPAPHGWLEFPNRGEI